MNSLEAALVFMVENVRLAEKSPRGKRLDPYSVGTENLYSSFHAPASFMY